MLMISPKAGFSVGGPDVLSLAAGEAVNPRKVMPFAFKSVRLAY